MLQNFFRFNEFTTFFGTLFGVFFITTAFLYMIDFVPESRALAAPHLDAADAPEALVAIAELPTRITIPKIGVDTPIENPGSATIEALDEALLAGAVRYPGSALLGENAPVFLFGHQSYLPVVRNPAYKAFNDLQKLSQEDVITVYSDTAAYEYTVTSVSLARAEDVLIPLTPGAKTLTLSTCNSFGDPGERYVVTATFTTRIPLP